MRKKIKNWKARFNPIGLIPKKGSNINFRSNKKKRKITFRQIFKFAVYIIAAFFVFAVLSFAFYSKDLPNPNKIADRKIAQSTKIYDRDWKLLYEFHGEENRTVIKSNEISKFVKEATVAIEDKHFYQHPGIDVGGVVKAVGRKFLGQKSRLGGGSTITQQYIKNALLSDERRVSRKIKELILSLEIEQIYSKDEILTGYLNQIPYGNNAYGIEAASETYFDKKANELTLAEAATLAALPQAPSYYNANTDILIGRKNHVLDRMVEEKMITKNEAEKAKKQPPNETNLNFAAKAKNITAPHFVFYVREKLIDLLGGGSEAEIKLSTTGFKVRTTLDRRMQKSAETAVDQYKNKLSSAGASNAALTAVDPKTGEILAMVGSVDFNNKEFGSVNVATS
ncbi:MAG: penicillin-binding protein, 1A family, partial [uncultured bacterium]